MAVEVTPLGFQKPDGNERVRDGDNVISANAQKAEDLHASANGRLGSLETRTTTAETTITSQGTRLTTTESVALQAVPRWKANTPYLAGQQVVNSTGEVVSAKVAFTSGATYNATNWNPSGLSTLIDTRGLPQRELVTGEDINNIREPGVYTCPSTAIAATLINWPAGSFTGDLFVRKAKAGLFTSQDVLALVSSVNPPDHYNRVTRSSNNTTWTPWGYKGWPRGPLADGTNLDTFREPGAWTNANVGALVGVPDGWSTGAVTVENHVSSKTALALQRITHEDGRIATRTAKVLAGWGGVTWKLVSAGTTPVVTVTDAGLANAVRIQDFTQKMGGRRKVTTATVAFRYDHGLNNLNGICRPVHEANNWKYSIALCSGRWTFPENDAVTQAAVNAWVTAGLAEIWNHSKDHGSGDNSEAAWKAAILDGLRELETQLPAAAGKIFGFAPPGSTGTDFGGFIFGQTLDEFLDTDGIRWILKYHAVAAGYLATKRVQDGMVRQGMGHITMDNYSLATVQSHVEQAEAGKTALQIMLHPSRLDTAGYMTTATYQSIMAYIKAEETAGRLKVVSPYEQLLCDVT